MLWILVEIKFGSDTDAHVSLKRLYLLKMLLPDSDNLSLIFDELLLIQFQLPCEVFIYVLHFKSLLRFKKTFLAVMIERAPSGPAENASPRSPPHRFSTLQVSLRGRASSSGKDLHL